MCVCVCACDENDGLVDKQISKVTQDWMLLCANIGADCSNGERERWRMKKCERAFVRARDSDVFKLDARWCATRMQRFNFYFTSFVPFYFYFYFLLFSLSPLTLNKANGA